MFQNMVQPLLAQANRIAKHDDDLAQNIISMAFLTYNSALNRGKSLSIAELVNLMKYRAGDLRSGKRLYFGNTSNKTTHDVYNPCNYYNGDVELLSLDFSTNDNECSEESSNGLGELTAATASRDCSNNVLFEIGFAEFFKQLTSTNRRILRLRLHGFNCSEIGRMVDFRGKTVQVRLKKIGRSFIEYFALPKCYLERYDLA
jgi:hypothetical protein